MAYTSVAMHKHKLTKEQFSINFGIYMFVLLCLYPVILITVFDLRDKYNLLISSTLYSVPIILMTWGFLLYHVYRSGFSRRFFGLTCADWPRQIIVGVIYALPIVVIIIGVKYLLVHYHPLYLNQELFFSGADARISTKNAIITSVLYTLFIPVQESIRLIVQNSLKVIFHGKVLPTFFLSALSFAISHSHLSLHIVVACFILGLFFAYLVHKENSIVSVSVLHLLIGHFAFYVVGF
jgi:hypothetical protein